jgi:hypothetical protein
MATTYKILAQNAPSVTTEVTLYTCASALGAVCSTLAITNLTSAAANATISVCQAGAATANANTLLKTVSIPALSVVPFTIGLTLANTDVVRVTSGTANALAFQMFGNELS